MVCHRNEWVATVNGVWISVGAAMLLCTACAQRPENITPRFASAAPYRAMTCAQINEERMRVGLELQRSMMLQRENANADAAMMGVGVLFPPLLLGLAATTDRRDQIATIMGERDALDLAAREKNCPPVNLPALPPPPSPPST
jgi:hypothetical protein